LKTTPLARMACVPIRISTLPSRVLSGSRAGAPTIARQPPRCGWAGPRSAARNSCSGWAAQQPRRRPRPRRLLAVIAEQKAARSAPRSCQSRIAAHRHPSGRPDRDRRARRRSRPPDLGLRQGKARAKFVVETLEARQALAPASTCAAPRSRSGLGHFAMRFFMRAFGCQPAPPNDRADSCPRTSRQKLDVFDGR